MERNYYYQQLIFVMINTKDRETRLRIRHAIKTCNGNMEYLKDMYQELVTKRAKRTKVDGKNCLVLEGTMYRYTSYKFNPWFRADE